MDIKNTSSGITLIALVITIIVLLILAAVSIATLTGDNGILTQAQNAKTQTEKSSIKEQIELAIVYSRIDKDSYSNINTELLEKELKNNLGSDITIEKNGTDNGLPWTIKIGNYSFDIEKDGRVIETGEVMAINAKVVKEDSQKYYGKTVSNYTCTDTSVGWKIFHADDENIYLVADRYTSKETSVDLSSYKGSADITNSNIKKYLRYVDNYPNNENENMKATAYMLDVNKWTKFKGNNAEYAIGGPTIEMYVASFNSKNAGVWSLEYEIAENGYELIENGNGMTCLQNFETKSYIDDIYALKENKRWIIASPSTYAADQSVCVYDYTDGDDGSNFSNIAAYSFNSSEINYFRPVVCLRSTVQLEEQTDGTYKIK